ncbi:hypothetical protein PLICBS_007524 [Purpureocillium lilacinum]|uniref:uncharacterized protein n=1 Tax=Purpureocillium lilacinum TaxID=33203 RepID=UPI00208141CF|nr:hypothetical protein PLICBS_007524 [Purpureocillium lilacinum]
MCFHFISWNACPVCSTTFNKRRNLVPCWNGDIASPLSSSSSSPSSSSSSSSSTTLRRPKAALHVLRHHGLRCRSGHYAESESETYTDRPCGACAARIAWNNTRDIGRARREQQQQIQNNHQQDHQQGRERGPQQEQQEERVVELASYGGGLGAGTDRMPLGHVELRLAHVDYVVPQVKAEYGVSRGRRGGRREVAGRG